MFVLRLFDPRHAITPGEKVNGRPRISVSPHAQLASQILETS
jgi:hypothetical protein